MNRRDDLLAAALAAFVERGYEGTSVADLAQATGLSKAAFVYHFASKEALLFELANPLLDELDRVVAEHESTATGIEDFVADYLAVLCRHRATATWVDGDKSILNHGLLGQRLEANNRRAHQVIAGHRPSAACRARASAVLGMLWRPVRNGYLGDDAASQQALVDLAVSAAGGV